MASTRLLSLKSPCGGGVPFSHPSLGLPVFFLRQKTVFRLLCNMLFRLHQNSVFRLVPNLLGRIVQSTLRRLVQPHVIKVFELLSDAIIEMVQMIMKIAPFGVFAMMAAVVADLGKEPGQLAELMSSLGGYMGTVVLALFVHYLLVYTVMLKVFTRVPWRVFAKALIPAQLLAFSSSSSAATLLALSRQTGRPSLHASVPSGARKKRLTTSCSTSSLKSSGSRNVHTSGSLRALRTARSS